MVQESRACFGILKSKYSVLFRVRNALPLLAESLKALAEQTLPPSQIIIVDNSDEAITAAWVSQQISLQPSKVNVIRYTDEIFNYSRALNLGLLSCENEFVLLLSSHVCLLKNNALELAVLELISNKEVAGITFGREPSKGVSNSRPAEINLDKNPTSLITSNSAHFIKLSCWQEIQFDENLTACEDKLWERQLRKKGYVFGFFAQAISYQNQSVNWRKSFRDALVLAKFVEDPDERRKKTFVSLRVFAISSLQFNCEAAKKAIASFAGRSLACFYPSSLIPKSTFHNAKKSN